MNTISRQPQPVGNTQFNVPASTAVGDVEMKPWGKHMTTANKTVTHPPVPAVTIRDTPNVPTVIRASAPLDTSESQSNEDGSLVYDLLNENSRLKAMLNETRKASDEQGRTTAGPVVTGLSSTERVARAE